MTRDDPFEKVLRDEERERTFPLWLSIATIAATGVALAASAAGVQWGAAPERGDALRLSWAYVNVAVLWAWLLVWPAAALGRRELPGRGGQRGLLLLDFAVMAISVLPATAVARFLSDVPARAVWMAVALQAGMGVFTMGVLAWHRVVAKGLLAGVTATLAVGVPVLGYLSAEFVATGWQRWVGYTPVGAIAVAVSPREVGSFLPFVVAGVYGGVGVVLFFSVPRGKAAE